MTPILKPLGPEDVSEKALTIFQDFLRERGNIPNMFRTLAHSPAILETCFAHFRAVMAPGAVPARVKELVALAVSYANECDYCVASHSKIAQKLGVTDAGLADLEHGGNAQLSEGERAAVELARAMRDGGRRVPRAKTDAVIQQFGEKGLLEIVMVAGLFHYFNRVNNVLEVEVTK